MMDKRKKVVLVGGTKKKLDVSLIPKLEEHGIDVVHHHDPSFCRKPAAFPPHDAVIILHDCLQHKVVEMVLSQNLGESVIYGSRKWSHSLAILKQTGLIEPDESDDLDDADDASDEINHAYLMQGVDTVIGGTMTELDAYPDGLSEDDIKADLSARLYAIDVDPPTVEAETSVWKYAEVLLTRAKYVKRDNGLWYPPVEADQPVPEPPKTVVVARPVAKANPKPVVRIPEDPMALPPDMVALLGMIGDVLKGCPRVKDMQIENGKAVVRWSARVPVKIEIGLPL